MGLKDFLALNDKALAKQYDYVAPDKTIHRKSFLIGLTTVERQFGEGRQPRSGMWSAKNDVVRFEPKLSNAPVEIEGETVFHIPSERFLDALKTLRTEVEAGTLDDALHAAHEGAVAKSSPSKVDDRVGSVRAGWSPERRERFAASIAAKRANKPK